MSNSKGWGELGAAGASDQRTAHLERKDKTEQERVRLFGTALGRTIHGGTHGRKGWFGEGLLQIPWCLLWAKKL